MLRWILGEVVVGLLVAGLALAVVVPAVVRWGYETGPAFGVIVAAGALVASVMCGERLRRRRKARESS